MVTALIIIVAYLAFMVCLGSFFHHTHSEDYPVIITDDPELAADAAALLLQRECQIRTLKNVVDAIGQVENELEERGVIVDRVTERIELRSGNHD